MRENRTSGSMSGERKRSDGHMAPSNRATPRLYPYLNGLRQPPGAVGARGGNVASR
jgi:hypothetical protein